MKIGTIQYPAGHVCAHECTRACTHTRPHTRTAMNWHPFLTHLQLKSNQTVAKIQLHIHTRTHGLTRTYAGIENTLLHSRTHTSTHSHRDDRAKWDEPWWCEFLWFMLSPSVLYVCVRVCVYVSVRENVMGQWRPLCVERAVRETGTSCGAHTHTLSLQLAITPHWRWS